MFQIVFLFLSLLFSGYSSASESQALQEFRKLPFFEEIKQNFDAKLKEFKSSFVYDYRDEYTKRDILFGPTALEIKNPGNFEFCRSLLFETCTDASEYLDKFHSYNSRFLRYDEELEIWVLMEDEDAKSMISWYMESPQSYCFLLGL